MTSSAAAAVAQQRRARRRRRRRARRGRARRSRARRRGGGSVEVVAVTPLLRRSRRSITAGSRARRYVGRDHASRAARRRSLALAARAAPAAAARRTPSPWATVNVCDTAKHPDAIGIRASMPGTPRGARLTMRFRVQYRDGGGRVARRRRAPTPAGAASAGARRAGRVGLELHASRTRVAGDAARRGALPLAQGDALPRQAELRHRGRPPLQRGRRPGRATPPPPARSAAERTAAGRS